ncbi:hypothetical protein [Pleurocapsa sp. PCC 7319]|uniref:hypothetical protein n=1 Tax=Pleurocapsa sp. PCC 7319 TaxID=118161 RepID=UPI0003492554|nr:hypothetical protein [Pleurocapsa sp. PCC 7319]
MIQKVISKNKSNSSKAVISSENIKYLELPEVLYQLIYHHSFRKQFLKNEWSNLPIKPSDKEHLSHIDTRELVKMSNQICRELLYGKEFGKSGLIQYFSNTFKCLSAYGQNAKFIVQDFMESEAFRDSRDVEFAGQGISLEEAFYLYLSQNRIFMSATKKNRFWLQHDFLKSLLSLLVINQEPNFRVLSSLIQQNSVCYYSLPLYPSSFVSLIHPKLLNKSNDNHKVCFLYAASSDTFVSGPIHEVARDMLALNDIASIYSEGINLAKKFNITFNDILYLAKKLTTLGLLKDN